MCACETTHIRFVMNEAPIVEGWSSEYTPCTYRSTTLVLPTPDHTHHNHTPGQRKKNHFFSLIFFPFFSLFFCFSRSGPADRLLCNDAKNASAYQSCRAAPAWRRTFVRRLSPSFPSLALCACATRPPWSEVRLQRQTASRLARSTHSCSSLFSFPFFFPCRFSRSVHEHQDWAV